jgi:hypothetical protein
MDEVAKSVVSGLQVDRKLLVASAGSGQLALRNELESCVVTGLLLLPTELSASAVSGRRADRRLLIRSDFSEHLALPDELLVCGESGRRGVPSDGVVCSETAQWVGRQYAATCTVTGKPVRALVGVRSAISDRFMAPSVALRSIKTKSMLHPDETTFCHWNEGYLEKDETAMCHRTLLTFSGNLIDASGQFNRIVPLLFQDPNREDGTPFIELCRKAEPEKLKRLRRLIFFRKNPDSKILFFRGHVDSKWYMSVYYVVFAARWHKDSFEIITPLTTSDETSGWKELS